jgi:uncharacterized protein YjbJ (UPF0337 family)
MNKEQVTGRVDEAKGKLKEEWGKATKDTEKHVEGLADQAKGKIKKAFGDAKEEDKETLRKP